MYRSIVVGTDGSAAALGAVARAIDISQHGPGDCIIHVIAAHQPLSLSQLERIRQSIPAEFHDRVSADMAAREALGRATRLLRQANVSHTTTASTSAPADAVRDLADQVDADLIVVGCRGLGAGRRLILGSVSSSLAHDAPADVLIVRQEIEDETVDNALTRLGDAVSRFETDHPDLVKTISDVSYYLSGMGI